MTNEELQKREAELKKMIAEAFKENDELKYKCAMNDIEELNKKAQSLAKYVF